MALEDRTLQCRNCGKEFTFTSGEQTFFLRRGLLNDPQRCPLCRAAKRRERGDSRQEMTVVVCASCGSETTVPFVPRLDKPVYCNLCFEKMRPPV
ncbi:MAG: zinc-ribbon domain containing protein [Dehalococcoidia bacterium]